VRIGPFWTAVWSRGCGLASTTGLGEHEHGATFVQDTGTLAGGSALELARLAYSDRPLEAGIGLAADSPFDRNDSKHPNRLGILDLDAPSPSRLELPPHSVSALLLG